MFFSRVAVAILCLAAPFAAQSKKTEPTKAAKRSAYVSSERLLQRSYLLSKELSPDERIWLLTEITMPSAKWHATLMRPWAEEVFRLAGQMSPGYDRVVTQKNAATAMSWMDVSRAMQMLNQCDQPSAADSDVEDVRDVAARRIFPRYWETAGRAALPQLRRTANHLGDTGQYPYGAMVPVIQGVNAKDPATALTLMGEAVAFYHRGSPFQTTTEEFIDFLKRVKPLMPPAARKEALEAVVKDLTASPGGNENQQWRTRVYTEKGVADFHSRNAKLLFDVLPMIREVDPEWAQQLVAKQTDLAQADAARGKILNAEGGVVMKNPDNPPSAAELASKEQMLLELGRLDQIHEIAAKDPDQALTLAMSIADPGRRAVGMAYAAAGFGNHPDQAMQMLGQSQQSLAGMKKNGEKLDTYVAIAESASSLHDFALARDAAEKGLDLGEEAYEESRKEHSDWHAYQWEGMDAAQKLVEIGTRIDAARTVGRVEAIRDHTLQGYMLVSVARAMDEDGVGGWTKALGGG